MTSPFYSSEQTDLSRAVLGEVMAAVPKAILIGGWASWVRTGGAMSHDIDLIVSRAELELLGAMGDDLSESRHLGGGSGEPPGVTSIWTCTSRTSRSWVRTCNCGWRSWSRSWSRSTAIGC